MASSLQWALYCGCQVAAVAPVDHIHRELILISLALKANGGGLCMSLRGLNLFNNQNTPNFIQSLGQNSIPLRGLERFMLKRGMNFPEYPQGGISGPNFQGPTSQGVDGSLSNTLNVKELPEKSGGIKAFLSRFSRNRSK